MRFPKEVKNPVLIGESKWREEGTSEMNRKTPMISKMESESQQTKSVPRKRDFTGAFQKGVKELAVCFLAQG